MTKEAFAKLAGAGVILLDGATGSNLTKAGMPKGISTEIWTLEHADILIRKRILRQEARLSMLRLFPQTGSAFPISDIRTGWKN